MKFSDRKNYLYGKGDCDSSSAVVTIFLIPSGPYRSMTLSSVMPPFPSVHKSPGSPKTWSPWRWLMNTRVTLPGLMGLLWIWTWEPSPQSKSQTSPVFFHCR